MDNQKRLRLQAFQKDIVQDLDVKHIMDDLFTKNVLPSDIYDSILSNIGNRSDCTRYLVEWLIQFGDNAAFDGFVDSLSKDYWWLWEKLSIEGPSGEREVLSESVEDSLGRGDVPRLPLYYVSRTELEKNVATRLENLKRHETLVLHGMSGSGKSCVAAAALRNNPALLNENLATAVFWLNLATCRTEDDIRTQQLLLYRKASALLTPRDSSMFSSTMSMSSLGSTLDSQSLASVDNSWKDYRDSLRLLFVEQPLKEGLLVLDDVVERSVAEGFDIGCKLLVTTRDDSVVTTLHPIVITMDSGFTESESLELFAGCVGVAAEQLPRQARKIHALCRGGLLQISLLGANIAENRERLLHNPSHWNSYVENLTQKKFLSLIHMRRSDQVDPIKLVEMCINSLPPDVRVLFKKLAVLPDSVKVSARTLSTVWALAEPRVDGIMRQLRSKSLVEQHYVQEKKDYLYEVHEVILSCLRAMHSAEDRRRLHAELLSRYGFLDVTARALPRLADDGYIAFYLAHHINHTENTNNEWSLFNKLFLDLEFIGEKVRLAGQADTVSDLTVYQDKICRNEMDYALVDELRAWLGAHGGDLHRFPRTDIVQSVLQHRCSGVLYARAHALATRPAAAHRLYFSFLHEQDVEKDKCSTMDVGEAVSSVCFLGQYMLVGLHSGNIKVYNTHTYRMCKELAGDGAAVVWVGACPVNTSRVGSLDAAGALRVWCIDQLETPSPADPVDGDVDEPDENVVDCDGKEVRAVSEQGPFLNCRWTNNAELLVAHTASAVLAYTSDCTGVTRFPLASPRSEPDRRIVCCTLSANDATLLVAWSLGSAHHVDIYDCKSKERLLTFAHATPVLQILNIPNINSRILVVCPSEVVEHSWQRSASAPQRTGTTRTVVGAGGIRAGLRFLSGAVSVGGTLLFVATDDARVVCVDLATRAHLLDLVNSRGNVVSMDVSELWFDEFEMHYDVLGTGDEENAVKVWHLDTAYIAQASSRHRKARLTSNFACSFSCASASPASGRSPPATPSRAPATLGRAKSAAAPQDFPSRPLKPTNSLSERRSLKLNLNGISSCGDEDVLQPMLAVIDDKNNIQIMRGRRVFAEISEAPEDTITAIQISPCNRYVIFGVKSGAVKKFVMRSKETVIICDINSAVVYLEFVTPQLLIVSGKNRCVMAYRAVQGEQEWKLTMLLRGNNRLGSQEILNDISGGKKKTTDTCSNSSDGSSASTKPRVFASERARLGHTSSLVHCSWLEQHGLLTVEDNATVKLWDREMELASVLNGRQEVTVTCAACQDSTLAICDELGKFQTFRLHAVAGAGETQLQLNTLQECKLNNRITACAVSRAGRLLAVGLDNGNIVLWNIQAKYQIKLLKHHKSSVTALLFSPEPSNAAPGGLSPAPGGSAHNTSLEESDAAPLVLVSVAAEVLWWNVTHVIRAKQRDSKPRSSRSMLTPLSPSDRRSSGSFGIENLQISDSNSNHFFGNGATCPRDQWEALWKGKRSDTAPRELLACVKLAGVSARRLLADDTFTCFVTVDSSGAPHLMNLLRGS